jgi:hypothetical protein
MRVYRDALGSLPQDTFPGECVLALPLTQNAGDETEAEGSLVTVYGSADRSAAFTIWRVNLFASLYGIEQHVASAFFTNAAAPFSGLLMSATGRLVDCWKIYAMAFSPALSGFNRTNAPLSLAMSARRCCTDPFVHVPEALLDPFPLGETLPASFTDPAVVPLGRDAGQVVPFGGANALASPITFPAGSRLAELTMIPSGGAMTVSFTAPPAPGIVKGPFAVPAAVQELFADPPAILQLSWANGGVFGHAVR